MSESLTDSTDSNEIEIKLEKQNDVINNTSSDDSKAGSSKGSDKPVDVQTSRESTTKSYQTVEPKHIANLTDDERATIIASVRNGIEQPYYDVKFYKNGNTRIIKRKLKQPSTAQQIINSQPLPPTTEAKRYYTDNQLLFEHIIELNAKIDKLTAKHKKLKKKYTTIRNDIYADEDDIVEPSPLVNFDEEDNTTKPLSNRSRSGFADDLTDSNPDSAKEEGEAPNDSSLTNFTSANILAESSKSAERLPNAGFTNRRSNWRSQVKYL